MQFLDFIAAALVRLMIWVCCIVPTGWILKLGRGIGSLVFRFSRARRAIGYANLRAAFCRSKTPSELRKMTKAVYQNLAETFAEILCLKKIDAKYVDKYVDIVNFDSINKAVKKGKGVIFLTAHLGNWELCSAVSSITGYPLYVLARDQKMKRVYEVLNRIRELKGAIVVRKGLTVKYIVKALHEGKIIGMLADQNGGANGIMTDFFGRPASNAYGPYRFAAKTGAVILPVFMTRQKGPYNRAVIEEPIEIKDGENIYPYVKRYNDLLESHVKEHYDQWLWLHRRWKACPVKNITVLSDGKQGHLNQSLSLADAFTRYRSVKNIPDKDTIINVVEVRFRNKFWKTVINILGVFSGLYCQGRLWMLKPGLEKSSYEDLMRTYADVVISTGSSLAGVNSIYRYENNAKNAVCMKPGILSFRKFDMVVLPRHDMRKKIKDKKIVITDTAPNLMSDENMEKAGQELLRHVRKDGNITIAVLLGGNNSNFVYDEGIISGLIKEVIAASKSLKADILFTTSRRTDSGMERIVKESLKEESSCKFLVIANENNPSYALSGMLALSDIVVVSGESISMVSEAVSAGKRTVVFKGKKIKCGGTRHEMFLERLRATGTIKVIDHADIRETVCRIIHEEPPRKKTKEEDLVYMNMWRLGG